MFTFLNKDVAAKYEPALGKDKTITMPGMYAGPLSGIPIEVADKMLADGDNQLKLKSVQYEDKGQTISIAKQNELLPEGEKIDPENESD